MVDRQTIMKYKLLALDIDGTVVKEHTNTPTPKVIDAIRKANAKVHVTMVSARAWKDQKIIIDLLHLKDFYHVVENGTKVINPLGKLVLIGKTRNGQSPLLVIKMHQKEQGCGIFKRN